MVNRSMFAATLCVATALTTALGSAGQAQPTPPEAQRFDELVRADFFAGVAGDVAALDRAMRLIEATLAKNPERPDVLVWRGAGLVARAGQAFEKGDTAASDGFWQRGLKEMDQAVTMAPDSIAVARCYWRSHAPYLIRIKRRRCWQRASPITRRRSLCRRRISGTYLSTHGANSCSDSPKAYTASANGIAPAHISSVCGPKRGTRNTNRWPQHG
jgi:hypothetical protein